MSGINPVGNSGSIQQVVGQPIARPAESEQSAPPRGGDRLELSGMGHLLKSLKGSEIRGEKVTAIKAEIEAGKYDGDGAKLDAAIDRLLDELIG